VAKTTYNIQEFRQRLAKHIEGMIDRVAGDFQDLAKREDFKKSLWATAHEEPGVHSPEAPGEQPHMEPGGDEQFALNPPATPEAATAVPIHGGNGVPPGQLDNPGTPGADAGADPMCSLIMGDGPCPLCQQPEQGCKCLDQMILGKSMAKLPDGSGAMTGTVGKVEKNASMGYGSGGSPPAGGAGALSMSEMCKACGQGHGKDPCSVTAKTEADGRNGDPTKKQPTKPVAGSKLPPESTKKVKGPDDAKVKENPLGKNDNEEPAPHPDKHTEEKCGTCGQKVQVLSTGALATHSCVKKTDVPQAKPPSGKVPGGTSNPPMASTSSKQTLKEEPMEKAVLSPTQKPGQSMVGQMKGGGSAGLTHPTQMGRANTNAAALAGEFQPKGPVTSGLELAPKGLTAPPPAARQGGVPAPKMAGMPKPTMPAVPAPKPGGVFGHLFGKSEGEKCALCSKAEHVGECK
jgi:hypothetical protein